MNVYSTGANTFTRISSINRSSKNRLFSQLLCAAVSLLGAGTAVAQTNLALNKTTFASSELRAAKDAVDGSGYSRWESTHGIATGWLTVDLGAATNLGQVAIDWEAANPEIYQIQGSNNNSTWTTLATKTGGIFGNRTDTFAVSGSYRYVRVYATKPASGNAWGYSIFELRVLGGTAGSSSSSTSSSSSSSTGNLGYTPLFPAGTQVTEQIQYREADGTLVTLIGMRSTERHARERGEPWLAANDADGRYFTYPPFYFQNRSFGLKVRDTIPAGGNNIRITMLINEGTFFGTTFSLFRNSSDPTVTEFGWALNYGFNNLKEGNLPRCFDGGNEDCYMDVDSYWNTGPNPHRPLVMGDRIELAPAPRLVEMSETDNRARLDGGGSRYYSFEQLYVVGEGVRPWYGIQPNLDSEPVPGDALLGGETSVSYNYSEEPYRVFQQMANNIGIRNTDRFLKGRRLFHTSFATGQHSEFPVQNPIFNEHVNQLGSNFNDERCIACHQLNGRSKAAVAGAALDTLSVLTGAPGNLPDPTYGFNVLQKGAVNNAVKLQRYDVTPRFLNDGTRVDMHKPVYEFTGVVPQLYSVRQAPQVIGTGLLEAIPEATILSNIDVNDANGDGIRGRANYVKNPETGATQIGRFGWKAAKVSVRHQSAEALVQDMGVTSPVYPVRSCQKTDTNCHQTGVSTHVSELELTRLTNYLQLIGVPAQRSYRSGYPNGMRVSVEHDVNQGQIAQGKMVFENANCVGCHKSSLQTGNTHPFAELRNQTIRPYTDLLLHDMGPDLADSLPQDGAPAAMWRTAPLWGLGSLKYVQSGTSAGNEASVRYLHDGRAHTLDEAILWHGGEATNSRLRYEALSTADRNALKAFLYSL